MPEGGRDVIGKLAGQRPLVDLADEAAERFGNLWTLDISQVFLPLLEQGDERALALQRGAEFLDVLGRHASHPIKTGRVVRRDTGKAHRREAAVCYQRRARQ